MRVSKRHSALLLALAMGAAATSHAAVWTVDDDGSANFTTLSAAVAAAASGDTIVVKPGTYTSTSTLTIAKKLRIVGPYANVSPVTALAERTAEAVLQFNTSSDAIRLNTGSSGTEFIGLKIRGNATGAGIIVSASPLISNINEIKIQRCYLENFTTKFYSVGNGAGTYANDWLVEDNLMKDWGAGAAAETAVFHGNSYRLTFRNNRLTTTTGNGDDRALNFTGLMDSTITGNYVDTNYPAATGTSATTQIGNGCKRTTFSNNYLLNSAGALVIYSGTDNTALANFTAQTVGDGANNITESITASDNLVESFKNLAIDVQAGSDRDDIKDITVSGNTVRQDVVKYRAAAANTGVTALNVTAQNGTGGTDVLSNIADNISITNNSVQFSGTAFGDSNVVSFFGIRVRNRVEDVTVQNNTFQGVNVGTVAAGNFPPSAGLYVTTTQAVTVASQLTNISLPSTANVQVSQNTFSGFPNAVAVLGLGLTATNTPVLGDLENGSYVTAANNDLGTFTGRGVLSGTGTAYTGTFNAASNFWGTLTPTVGAQYDGNVDVSSPLASGRTAGALTAATPVDNSTITLPENDVVSPKATTATFSIQNAGQKALTVTSLAITGTNAADFTASLALDVAGGTTRSYTVSFNPSASGSRTATLTVTTGAGTLTYTLSGNAVASGPAATDTDFDGLTDTYETVNGLNASNRDSDGDGLLDGTEVAIGTDPSATTAYTDADGDKLPDNGGIDTDATNVDSDGDGFSDGFEVASGTGATNAASFPNYGDVNGTGVTDNNDASVIFNYYLGNTGAPTFVDRADINRSGTVDYVDAVILFNWSLVPRRVATIPTN